jgi:WD40 repeat protein
MGERSLQAHATTRPGYHALGGTATVITLIASASRDKTVRLWDVKAGAGLAVLPHGADVYGVAFIPDGTRLATACRDNTIRLWDVATREEVAELRGHADYVHAVAFSPDGARLASASGDFTVRMALCLKADTGEVVYQERLPGGGPETTAAALGPVPVLPRGELTPGHRRRGFGGGQDPNARRWGS